MNNTTMEDISKQVNKEILENLLKQAGADMRSKKLIPKEVRISMDKKRKVRRTLANKSRKINQKRNRLNKFQK